MPLRPRTHEQETESNRAFERALPSGWVDRRLVPDYGLDYTVEIFDEDGRTTPFSFHAQLKATDEIDRAKALSSLRFDREWAEHYWSLPIPVLVVRYLTHENRLYARWFHAYNPHVALREETEQTTKTFRFEFTEADLWSDETPTRLRAAVEAFMRFRSPELQLPLRFAVSSSEGDVLPTVFALRNLLSPVADIVAVEPGAAEPDRPHITLGLRSSTVALADVASLTLDYEDDERDPKGDAANLATAVAVALTRVGQSNLAAQVAASSAATSTAILDYDVVFALAYAFYRSRRISDALRLADRVAERENFEGRLASLVLQTAVLAKGDRLTDEEADLAVEVSRRSMRRTEDAGETGWAAADAYNLGQSLRRRFDRPEAIAAYRKAASLDPSYEDRGYYNGDLAGLLFEDGQFEESAERYGRAFAVERDPFLQALQADALLWSGEYAAAQEALDRYTASGTRPRDAEWRLKHRGLTLLRKFGGDAQDRDADRAASLIAPYELDSGSNFSPDDAVEGYRAAVGADACCAEAWFRLAFLTLVLSDGASAAEAFEYGLLSAVLHRESPGAWNNAIRMLRIASLAEDLARDCLRMAYRFCGPSLAEELMTSTGGPEGASDAPLLAMLDEVMREFDEDHRPTEFTLRLPDGEGGMAEFAFVTEVPEEAMSEAHDPLHLTGDLDVHADE